MKYALSNQENTKSFGLGAAFKSLGPLLARDKKSIVLASVAVIFNSGLNLLAPLVLGYTIDHFIATKQFSGVLSFSAILLAIYIGTLVTSFLQTRLMGGVGQRLLFSLRNEIFNKLQGSPVDFFNQKQTMKTLAFFWRTG